MHNASHHRRSIRIPDYDYSQPGAYFITLCTWQKQTFLGEIVDHQMKLSFAGRIVEKEIQRLPSRFTHTEIINSVVMPNHIHMIIEIMANDDLSQTGTGDTSPDSFLNLIPHARTEQFGQPVPGSIPTIIRSFKSSVSYHLHFTRDFQNTPIWQRNYYEHIIRSADELQHVHNYITSNPANWLNDDQYP